MSEQKIISLDQTVLNTVQNCAMKAKLSFHENLKPNTKAQSLEEGDLMHKMLEIYYSIRGNCTKESSDTWQQLREAGLTAWKENYDLSNALVEFACEAGRFFAAKMNTPPEELEEVIHQFKEYTEFYKNEPWKPLAVEEVGAKILFEDEEWKILYSCKTDLIAQQAENIIPWDHKTGKRRETPRNTSNQFRGTCFVLGKNDILINKIGFQKTLSASERFQRFSLRISDELIAEWVTDTIWWAKLYHWYIENDTWPRDFTSCDKYSGCIYRPLCEDDPRHRLYTIEQNFHTGEQWDVTAVLAGGGENG